MRECTACITVKPLNEFSAQKTNPKKLYAWCDDCRRSNAKPMNRRSANYACEIAEMRRKAKQLRKFDDTQAAELHKRHMIDKVPLKTLAAETGAAVETVRKTIKRAGRKNAI